MSNIKIPKTPPLKIELARIRLMKRNCIKKDSFISLVRRIIQALNKTTKDKE